MMLAALRTGAIFAVFYLSVSFPALAVLVYDQPVFGDAWYADPDFYEILATVPLSWALLTLLVAAGGRLGSLDAARVPPLLPRPGSLRACLLDRHARYPLVIGPLLCAILCGLVALQRFQDLPSGLVWSYPVPWFGVLAWCAIALVSFCWTAELVRLRLHALLPSACFLALLLLVDALRILAQAGAGMFYDL